MDNQDIKEISISTENYDILSSGSVIIPVNEKLVFNFDNITIDFVFTNSPVLNDSGNEIPYTVFVDKESKNTVHFKFGNVKHYAFGTPTGKMALGRSNSGREISLKMVFQSIGDIDNESYLFFYTWYLKK